MSGEIVSLDELYQAFDGLSIEGGWHRRSPALWQEPRKTLVPHRWRFSDVRPILAAAGDLVDHDMADRRNSMKAHQTDASLVENEVLSGVVAPRGEAVTGPPWVVPAECPGCGAAVDQATAAMDLAPRCAFCHQPLPAEPRARF